MRPRCRRLVNDIIDTCTRHRRVGIIWVARKLPLSRFSHRRKLKTLVGTTLVGTALVCCRM
jgi:hypothetical protein